MVVSKEGKNRAPPTSGSHPRCRRSRAPFRIVMATHDWADKETVLKAVKNTGNALKYASVALKADKEVVMAAVKRNGYALYHASPALRADKKFVMEAVKKDGNALEWASAELKADKEVVLEAVKQHGWTLQFASEALGSDKHVVLEAVKRDGLALLFASRELQSKPHLKLLAASSHEHIEAIVRASKQEALDVQQEVADALIFKSTKLAALEPLAAEVAAALYAPNGPMSKRDRAAFDGDFGQAQ